MARAGELQQAFVPATMRGQPRKEKTVAETRMQALEVCLQSLGEERKRKTREEEMGVRGRGSLFSGVASSSL
jgi:hypothetical protein